jgi:hypothetical protein
MTVSKRTARRSCPFVTTAAPGPLKQGFALRDFDPRAREPLLVAGGAVLGKGLDVAAQDADIDPWIERRESQLFADLRLVLSVGRRKPGLAGDQAAPSRAPAERGSTGQQGAFAALGALGRRLDAGGPAADDQNVGLRCRHVCSVVIRAALAAA